MQALKFVVLFLAVASSSAKSINFNNARLPQKNLEVAPGGAYVSNEAKVDEAKSNVMRFRGSRVSHEEVVHGGGIEHTEVAHGGGIEHGEVAHGGGIKHGEVAHGGGIKHGEVAHGGGIEHGEVAHGGGIEHGGVANGGGIEHGGVAHGGDESNGDWGYYTPEAGRTEIVEGGGDYYYTSVSNDGTSENPNENAEIPNINLENVVFTNVNFAINIKG